MTAVMMIMTAGTDATTGRMYWIMDTGTDDHEDNDDDADDHEDNDDHDGDDETTGRMYLIVATSASSRPPSFAVSPLMMR